MTAGFSIPKSNLKTRKSKYRAMRTIVGDLKFDSKKEAECWLHLKARERAGEIHSLTRQVRYALYAASENEFEGVKVCTYVADFRNFDNVKREWIVADAKGFVTAMYKLKEKMMLANYGIKIERM